MSERNMSTDIEKIKDAFSELNATEMLQQSSTFAYGNQQGLSIWMGMKERDKDREKLNDILDSIQVMSRAASLNGDELYIDAVTFSESSGADLNNVITLICLVSPSIFSAGVSVRLRLWDPEENN